MGYSYEKACAITEETLAVPGASEHQAGLSVDIVTLRHQVLNDAFADTKAGKWLAEHAHEYGFILRYPKDKEEITGINYEPWHFRYVGKEAAEQIYELGCCLEEYVMLQNQLAILNISDKTKDY
jgi:D-alanyl-D-alanine carboxypeptidase